MSASNQNHVLDNVLLEQLKKGNRIAFKALYEQLWDNLFQTAYRLLNDVDLAKDVVQDVFIDFWDKGKYQQAENIAGYLYQSVRFHALKQLRKADLLDIHQEHFQGVVQSNQTEEQINLNQLQASLEKSLNSLPDKTRRIFVMSRQQQMSNKEIADKLQLSIRTVEWYLHTALRHLKTSLTSLGLIVFHLFVS